MAATGTETSIRLPAAIAILLLLGSATPVVAGHAPSESLGASGQAEPRETWTMMTSTSCLSCPAGVFVQDLQEKGLFPTQMACESRLPMPRTTGVAPDGTKFTHSFISRLPGRLWSPPHCPAPMFILASCSVNLTGLYNNGVRKVIREVPAGPTACEALSFQNASPELGGVDSLLDVLITPTRNDPLSMGRPLGASLPEGFLNAPLAGEMGEDFGDINAASVPPGFDLVDPSASTTVMPAAPQGASRHRQTDGAEFVVDLGPPRPGDRPVPLESRLDEFIAAQPAGPGEDGHIQVVEPNSPVEGRALEFTRIYFVNGILNTQSEAIASAHLLADVLGEPVVSIYSASAKESGHGAPLIPDSTAAIASIPGSGGPAAEAALATSVFLDLVSGRDVLIFAHSRGAKITQNAVFFLADMTSWNGTPQLLGNVTIVTAGGFSPENASLWPTGPSLLPLRNRTDIVPVLHGNSIPGGTSVWQLSLEEHPFEAYIPAIQKHFGR